MPGGVHIGTVVRRIVVFLLFLLELRGILRLEPVCGASVMINLVDFQHQLDKSFSKSRMAFREWLRFEL
jgi:hypothetical protein